MNWDYQQALGCLLVSILLLSANKLAAEEGDDWGMWEADQAEFIELLETESIPIDGEQLPPSALDTPEQNRFKNLDNSTLSDYTTTRGQATSEVIEGTGQPVFTDIPMTESLTGEILTDEVLIGEGTDNDTVISTETGIFDGSLESPATIDMFSGDNNSIDVEFNTSDGVFGHSEIIEADDIPLNDDLSPDLNLFDGSTIEVIESIETIEPIEIIESNETIESIEVIAPFPSETGLFDPDPLTESANAIDE